MFIMIYTLTWLACSLTICLLSYFVGRCSRKLPVIDDGLPWVLHRSQVPEAAKASLHGQADGHAAPPTKAGCRPHASNVIAPTGARSANGERSATTATSPSTRLTISPPTCTHWAKTKQRGSSARTLSPGPGAPSEMTIL